MPPLAEIPVPDRVPDRVRAALRGQPRGVQAEVLNVTPLLVGAPLAPPMRRAWALGVDLLVVALLSGVGGLWLVLGLLLVLLQLRTRRDRAGPADAASAPLPAVLRRRAWLGWAAAALLLALAAGEAQDRWDAWRHPAAARANALEADAEQRHAQVQALGEAADALKSAEADVPALAVVTRQVEAMAKAASGAAAAASVAGAASSPAPSPEALRIAQLEAELKDARRRQPLSWRAQWEQLWDDVAASLGWGIVYFSLLPAWWGGQTLGKKLFGLRVVELTGQPMTVMRCLKRYGGYAAGLSTGGLGFAQVLWDANRQGLHDKAAHTVVLDLRAPPLPPPPQPSPT